MRLETIADETRAAADAVDEAVLVTALRAGDESAFLGLVERYHGALIRLALSFVPNRDVAEEVVQETWLAVLRGLDRFEGRSTLRTWIFRILTNQAKSRGVREKRTVAFSMLADAETEAFEPAVDPSRFKDASHETQPGHWLDGGGPASWDSDAEARLLAKETLAIIERALDGLPPAQRTVMSLRDLQGWTSEEVCALLEISQGNQRVLLHRARSRVRAALEVHLATGADA